MNNQLLFLMDYSSDIKSSFGRKYKTPLNNLYFPFCEWLEFEGQMNKPSHYKPKAR